MQTSLHAEPPFGERMTASPTQLQPAQQAAASYISGVPAFVCIYGGSGLGKTTDCLYAFPRAFYFAKRGALASSEAVVGFRLSDKQVHEPRRISDVTEMLPRLGPDFDAAVVDDTSMLAERTLYLLEEKGYKSFALWNALYDEMYQLREAGRATKKHVILNSHETGPRTTKSGKFIKGGPQFPMDLAEKMPYDCDIVLRAFVEPTRPGFWKVVYRCNVLDTQYVTKNRHDTTPDMAPMNLGEILRINYPIRRAPGLEWIEDMAEWIAQADLAMPMDQLAYNASPYRRQIFDQALRHMLSTNTNNMLHIRWALRDGFDRAILRRWRMNPLVNFTA